MRVLIVEDDLKTIQDIQRFLQSDSSYTHIAYQNSKEVLKDLHQIKPDVALLEVANPEVDGFELAYHLMKAYPNLPIIFITSFNNHAAEAFELYTIDYLLKPISPLRLKSVLIKGKAMMRKDVEKSKGQTSIKLFGAMEVKLNARNIRFKRRKSKEILSYLILNNNQALISDLQSALFEEISPNKASVQLKAQLYQLRRDLISVQEKIQVELSEHHLHLKLKDVSIDYQSFMDMDPQKMSTHQLEKALLLYGRGLLLNFDCAWAQKDHLLAEAHFITLQQTLVKRLVEIKDYDKLKTAIFDLKPYLMDLESLDHYGQLIKQHFIPSVYEHFISMD